LAARSGAQQGATFMFPTASLGVVLGIPSLALGVLALALFGVQRVLQEPRTTLRLAIGSGAFLIYSALLAHSGLLTRTDLKLAPMLLLFPPLFLLSLGFAFSRVGQRIAHATPLHWLVGFHAFRLPLELVMHMAAREHVMPEQMTFTGWNFDILTGLSATALCLSLQHMRQARAWVLAFNVLGSLLLMAVISIALASLPMFHRFGAKPEQLNTWVAYFPYVWLPAGLVSAALIGHVLLWRRLLEGHAGAACNKVSSASGSVRLT
jgi:hypothetical protein